MDDALREGRSWSQIAAGLGISKQAAHKRHAGRAREEQVAAPAREPQRRLLVTGQARGVVELARKEAQALESRVVGPEHLLLGLLSDDHGTALRALESAGVRLETVRDALAANPRRSGPSADPGGRVTVSPETRTALEESLREAVRLRDSHLGVEHLLLALVRNKDAPAALAIAATGVEPEEVERRVYELVGNPGRPGDGHF